MKEGTPEDKERRKKRHEELMKLREELKREREENNGKIKSRRNIQKDNKN